MIPRWKSRRKKELKELQKENFKELRKGQDAILESLAEVLAGQNRLIHEVKQKVEEHEQRSYNYEKRIKNLERWKNEKERRTA